MLYLASQSPRRRELLAQLGLSFEVMHVDVDESVRLGEGPEEYVRRVAVAKAEAGLAAHPGQLVLGSDTAVVVDEHILGKPRDAVHAVAMLTELSGRSHRVLTGVALAGGERIRYRLSDSRVSFRAISEAEAWAYWRTGEPADKAGGYAIQGLGAAFVADLAGSYSGVMGLPLFETAQLLAEVGIKVFETDQTTDE